MAAELNIEMKDVSYDNYRLTALIKTGDTTKKVVLLTVGEHNGFHYSEEALKKFAEDWNEKKGD